MTTRTQTQIDVKNLCSRKLFELCESRTVEASELDEIVDELQRRRHYLSELERLHLQNATRH